MAEVAIPRNLFADILRLIAELRRPPDPAAAGPARLACVPAKTNGEVLLDQGTVTAKSTVSASNEQTLRSWQTIDVAYHWPILQSQQICVKIDMGHLADVG